MADVLTGLCQYSKLSCKDGVLCLPCPEWYLETVKEFLSSPPSRSDFPAVSGVRSLCLWRLLPWAACLSRKQMFKKGETSLLTQIWLEKEGTRMAAKQKTEEPSVLKRGQRKFPSHRPFYTIKTIQNWRHFPSESVIIPRTWYLTFSHIYLGAITNKEPDF